MKAFIDSSLLDLGNDTQLKKACYSEVEVLTYDNGLCKVFFNGRILEMNNESIFTDRNMKTQVPLIDLSKLPKELPGELIYSSMKRINSSIEVTNSDRIAEILIASGYSEVTQKLKDRVYRAFCDIYLLGASSISDRHTAFSDKLDLNDRNLAKELAMRIYFDSSFVRLMSGSEDVISLDNTNNNKH